MFPTGERAVKSANSLELLTPVLAGQLPAAQIGDRLEKPRPVAFQGGNCLGH